MNEELTQEQLEKARKIIYSQMGKKGGSILRDKKGPEYFAFLGRKSGEAKREKKRLERLSTYQFDTKTN